MRTAESDRSTDPEEGGDLAETLDARAAVETVSRAVREHPYVALGTAAGLGFLLGGGFGGRVFGAAIALGGRLAAEALLARALEREPDDDEAASERWAQ